MTTRPVTLVVLSKYKSVLAPFMESLAKLQPPFDGKDGVVKNIVFVLDGNDIPEEYCAGPFSVIVKGPEKFSMAGNGNLGLKAVPADNDVLYCGDDVRFLEYDTVVKLQEIAYKDETLGILSPRIVGRGSPTQCNPSDEITFCRPLEMWFPCVYIKRELINKIGYLDERFENFGSDDLDYCIRALLAGYSLGVTNKVAVQHEATDGGPTTFVKNIGLQEYKKQEKNSFEKIIAKYNVTPENFAKFLTVGDLSLLSNQPPALSLTEQQQREQAKEKLKTRSLYIATPCYGGMMTVNYTNSLIALINQCQNLGIRYTISFIYNESLITRARNKMVDDFLRKTNYTDFIFIDADIGFSAQDILSFLLYDEGVIGVPCVRKNLRLDRVVEAVKKNGRSYTIEELEQLLGEFVINFPPNGQPAKMDLWHLAEVQDVGTGIMRVRREVFEKVREAFPDRWYAPMLGEADADPNKPMFMFFQSCIDKDSGQYNPNGLPQYIPEDYAFCRLCRQVGIKIYAAPWVESSHAGTYIFRGSLPAVAKAGGKLR